jgi:hypothetical protein
MMEEFNQLSISQRDFNQKNQDEILGIIFVAHTSGKVGFYTL